MLLANTYHLALRPGAEVVRSLGGLHTFIGAGTVRSSTDSGGFPSFTWADRTRVNRPRRHIPIASRRVGSWSLTPESATAIQEALGADVAMCLDHCPSLPASTAQIADAVGRTVDWARRCKAAHERRDQALFGIVQGGPHADLRAQCASELLALDFDGYAVGGVSIGEDRQTVRQALAVTTHLLPANRPRYLMGVGRPQDILDAVATGIDLFDCVMPTRNGRNATCFTQTGYVKLRNAVHRLIPTA